MSISIKTRLSRYELTLFFLFFFLRIFGEYLTSCVGFWSIRKQIYNTDAVTKEMSNADHVIIMLTDRYFARVLDRRTYFVESYITTAWLSYWLTRRWLHAGWVLTTDDFVTSCVSCPYLEYEKTLNLLSLEI